MKSPWLWMPYPGFRVLVLASSLLLPSVLLAMGEYTLIPDAQFEQVLIDHGIDKEGVLDGRILTTDIEAASTITADAADIIDLTGIETARSLKSLLLFGNQLTTLDISDNQFSGIIDLSMKPDLISVDTTSNPNLLCVQVVSYFFVASSLFAHQRIPHDLGGG